MSTIILLDGNALFYPAPPDTLDISSVWNGNFLVCFQVHSMESLFSKFAKGVQHFSIYLARENMSGTTAVTNITLSHAADKKWPLTIIYGEGQQQQSCSHMSPGCIQASLTPCKPKEVSEPLRPVNMSQPWGLLLLFQIHPLQILQLMSSQDSSYSAASEHTLTSHGTTRAPWI